MSRQLIQKTNAVRLLDKEKIEYELVSYEVDNSDFSAIHVAEILGQNIAQVFKTLVLKGDKTEYFVCVIPGKEELNLKYTAQITDNKKCDLIPVKDLLQLTGYIRGACSPLGMKKQFLTYIDSSCMNFNFIFVSAGKKGLQIKIKPQDLLSITEAKTYTLI